ncbi:hypothetical protein V6N13_068626 [Hibiscus sabdariffa]|uniref:Uncharacterized protein n=1 Tax=Hibiscus sabdariffa TaxID=183260 RepID=A0ABR2QNQ8_9ROSI
MGDNNRRRRLLLAVLITMATALSDNRYRAVVASPEKTKNSTTHCNRSIEECFLFEVDLGSNNVGLAQNVFPFQVLSGTATCGRGRSGPCSPTPNPSPRKPQPCNNKSFNRNC